MSHPGAVSSRWPDSHVGERVDVHTVRICQDTSSHDTPLPGYFEVRQYEYGRMVPDILIDPDAFFEREALDPGWLRPTGIVLLSALVGVIGSIPIIRATVANLPPEVGSFSALVYVVGAAGGVVGTLIFWVLYAGLFHVISAAGFGGDGPFSETLKLTGWGFIPHVVSGSISAIVNFYVFSGVRFPSDPVQIQAFIGSLRSRPIFIVAELLGIAFLLWSAFLWTFAMRHGRNLRLKEAAITVAIPVAIGLLYRLYTILGGL